ncbi:hypothetical protein PybrP1_008030 [[Pythium] brassicae (nom. inval.)]|nr:hypothetical protein PybrP1_008030 [[Pythium] brassicae (nom. inval.)]
MTTRTDADDVADVARFETMAHQVGGHSTAKTSLKAHGGKVLKPFQNHRRGEREHEFYERVFRDPHAPAIYERLRPLVPGYHGVVVVADGADEHRNGKHLVMDDLTWGRRWPCIMDVKVGTRSYEDGASAEKIAYEKQKFPLQERVGFRIQGIKAFVPMTRAYVEFDKHFGRQVQSPEALTPAFAHFFSTLEGDMRKRTVLLKALETWFAEQQELEFVASSLLFLYNGEADSNVAATAGDSEAALALALALAPDIRLIDFAHVAQRSPDARQVDAGVLTGIRTITRCFAELLAQQSLA